MKYLIFCIITIFVFGCTTIKIPTEKFSQTYIPTPKINLVDNSLNIELKNPIHSPIRFTLESDNQNLNSEFEKLGTIELRAKSDTIIKIFNAPKFDLNTTFNHKWRLGSTIKKIGNIKLTLPFPKGKKHKVIQGNSSTYTHNTNYSRYAIDFDLKTNDTICSATNGFVVGVIDKYKYGGEGDKWRNYGNFITVYEPNSGIFTQYAHLVENGSLVKVGDKVKSGQAIGLSGKTGQTNVEHLHFNCLVPINNKDGLKSIPYEFIEGYKSTELKKGDLVEK